MILLVWYRVSQEHSSIHSGTCISRSFLSDHQSSLNNIREALHSPLHFEIHQFTHHVLSWYYKSPLCKENTQSDWEQCFWKLYTCDHSFQPNKYLQRMKTSFIFILTPRWLYYYSCPTSLYKGSFLPASSISLALPPTHFHCSLPESVTHSRASLENSTFPNSNASQDSAKSTGVPVLLSSWCTPHQLSSFLNPLLSCMKKPPAGHLEMKSYTGRYLLLPTALVARSLLPGVKVAPGLTPHLSKGPCTFPEGRFRTRHLSIYHNLPTAFWRVLIIQTVSRCLGRLVRHSQSICTEQYRAATICPKKSLSLHHHLSLQLHSQGCSSDRSELACHL